MKSFLSAFQFLTIIPARISQPDEKCISNSCVYFPLTGALIGLILFAVHTCISYLYLHPFLNSTITVISLIIITGGLHLDGLSDTFDALGSNKDRVSRLRIMRDSHTGAMGVLALISVILLKIFLLSEILSFNKLPALLGMCILSRWSQVLSIRIFTYARESGKAEVFFLNMNNRIFLSAGISALLFSLFLLKIRGLYLFITAGIFSFISAKLISSQFGGLSGDNIGAISEITEVFVLFSIVVLQHFS